MISFTRREEEQGSITVRVVHDYSCTPHACNGINESACYQELRNIGGVGSQASSQEARQAAMTEATAATVHTDACLPAALRILLISTLVLIIETL